MYFGSIVYLLDAPRTRITVLSVTTTLICNSFSVGTEGGSGGGVGRVVAVGCAAGFESGHRRSERTPG